MHLLGIHDDVFRLTETGPILFAHTIRQTQSNTTPMHFERQAVLDLERIVDLGHRRARKLRVHDGPDDFDDVSGTHVRLPDVSAEFVAAVDEP